MEHLTGSATQTSSDINGNPEGHITVVGPTLKASEDDRGRRPVNLAVAGARPKKVQAPGSKAAAVLKKLHMAKGATVEQLMGATGWQAHSVRGFLSGTVRKKLGLNLISEAGKDGVRRYRIAGGPDAGDHHAR